MKKVILFSFLSIIGCLNIFSQDKTFYPNKSATCGYVKITKVIVTEYETRISLEIKPTEDMEKYFFEPIKESGFKLQLPKADEYSESIKYNLIDMEGLNYGANYFNAGYTYYVDLIFDRINANSFSLIEFLSEEENVNAYNRKAAEKTAEILKGTAHEGKTFYGDMVAKKMPAPAGTPDIFADEVGGIKHTHTPMPMVYNNSNPGKNYIDPAKSWSFYNIRLRN